MKSILVIFTFSSLIFASSNSNKIEIFSSKIVKKLTPIISDMLVPDESPEINKIIENHFLKTPYTYIILKDYNNYVLYKKGNLVANFNFDLSKNKIAYKKVNGYYLIEAPIFDEINNKLLGILFFNLKI